MLRTKTMLLTVVVVALAVPTLWAQEANPDNSICNAEFTGSIAPKGYFSGTNKCSSGNDRYGAPFSLNPASATCSDSAGVEVTYGTAVTVTAVGASGSPWTAWGSPNCVGCAESLVPDIYGDLIDIQNSNDLTLTKPQKTFGFEISNWQGPHSYTVTFHTTTLGDEIAGPVVLGGQTPLDNGANRAVILCNKKEVTGAHISCNDCTELDGDGATGIAQIRGDKFKGF